MTTLLPYQLINTNKTGSAAPAGCVGEVISSNVLSAAAVTLNNNAPTNITSITLTPGDWDYWGQINFIPTGLTSLSLLSSWCSPNSATLPNDSDPSRPQCFLALSFTPSQGANMPTGNGRLTVSANTVIFLTCYVSYVGGSMKGYGNIQARRR